MKTKKYKRVLFEIGFMFNLFCVGVCCIIIANHLASDIEVELAQIVKILIPSIFDTITTGNPFHPTDFVNYLKYKLWLSNY